MVNYCTCARSIVHRYKKVFVYSTYKEAIAKFSLQAANLAGYKALQKEPTEATLTNESFA